MDYPDKILEKNNVKPTAMRLLILRYLINNNVMVSLTDIENMPFVQKIVIVQ